MSTNAGAPQKRPTLKAVRGTRDLLPDQTPLWNFVEATARGVFARYGFGEIRTPILEDTSLFARAVGEETDIVGKEMFTWEDGLREDLRSLESDWRRVHADLLDVESTFTLTARPIAWTVATIEGNLTFVEFRVLVPKTPDFELKKRNSELKDQGTLHRVVVPNWRMDLLDLTAYEDAGIRVEALSGRHVAKSESVSLRPENTAGVVRAYIEHKLGETGQLQKLYYIGPQFRRERPQKGRYRQFWQIGAEVIGPQSSGSESALRDAEVLQMLAALLDELGIRGWRLDLNSVGSSEDRARYNEALRAALAPVKDQLCPDNQRRAETNPLRVLDSKDENDQAIIEGLPKIADYLAEDSREHFQQVLAALDACGVKYNLNPRLVRGLDYYTRTTFEFTVTTGLGTQNALLGGGRYDGLSEMLGGPRAPGIGFAIGEDRLILTLQAQAEEDARVARESGALVSGASLASETWVPAWAAKKLDAYIAPLGIAQNPAALALAHELRSAGLTVEVGDGAFKLRKSFDVADSLARNIILLGEDEVATQTATVKSFASGEQKKIARAELIAVLR
ncbi:histidyl-tRNA synthetase [Bryocella elongata]|uniref:Histidine--tRNA ligase n=1 Tax=Bryocella elongata TaxID=863522 RepID=A0A1H6BJD0_9BACT|nr:histidine--tRNA ligase [Bryocella elongata]SEG60820.1 histidyl-tRNA synthetase [Bryocella elongata]